MVYIYTLIKDLPNYKAGTKFKVRELDNGEISINDSISGEYYEIRSILNNTEWMTRRINKRALNKLSCPKCGGASGVLYKVKSDEYDAGVHRHYITIWNECICGHKYKLDTFFTHSNLY